MIRERNILVGFTLGVVATTLLIMFVAIPYAIDLAMYPDETNTTITDDRIVFNFTSYGVTTDKAGVFIKGDRYLINATELSSMSLGKMYECNLTKGSFFALEPNDTIKNCHEL